MSCGSGGWEFPDDESKERYINEFTLQGDPRPKDSNGNPILAYPPSWLRPCSCERGSSSRTNIYYRILGVFAFRSFLKKFDCYPKTIRGTKRGTMERYRALIATVPLTITYEVPHIKTACTHFLVALIISVPFIILHDAGHNDLVPFLLGTPLLVLNLIVIYVIDLLPILVQRLNRAELYDAISQYHDVMENDEAGLLDHPRTYGTIT